MKKLNGFSSFLFLTVGLFSFLVFSCTNTTKTDINTDFSEDSITSIIENVEDDNSEPYTITKKKMSGYDVWEIVENRNKIESIPCSFEICPRGLLDRPISKTKKEQLKNAPVMYRDATWSAAYRAMKNLIPVRDSKIIFDYSKFNRQINNEKECLFQGDCQIKDKNGEYVDAVVSITVRWNVPDDFREPKGWFSEGNIVF